MFRAAPVSMEICLRRLKANVRCVLAAARPRGLIAVVKGGAYGHGAVEVGRALAEEPVSALATGSLEDAVAIRNAGIVVPIIMLGNLSRDSLPIALSHQVTPSISCRQAAEAVASASVIKRTSRLCQSRRGIRTLWRAPRSRLCVHLLGRGAAACPVGRCIHASTVQQCGGEGLGLQATSGLRGTARRARCFQHRDSGNPGDFEPGPGSRLGRPLQHGRLRELALRIAFHRRGASEPSRIRNDCHGHSHPARRGCFRYGGTAACSSRPVSAKRLIDDGNGADRVWRMVSGSLDPMRGPVCCCEGRGCQFCAYAWRTRSWIYPVSGCPRKARR